MHDISVQFWWAQGCSNAMEDESKQRHRCNKDLIGHWTRGPDWDRSEGVSCRERSFLILIPHSIIKNASDLGEKEP